MEKNTVQVSLFGSLSAAVEGGGFEVELASGSTVGELRSVVSQRLNSNPLIDSCAIASNDKVLSDSDELGEIRQIAVLPPVCGG